MAWQKKPIDRMEMMHILGLIYAHTAPGFGKVALEQMIHKEGGKTIKGKASRIVRALTRSGLLTYCGGRKARHYKWNMKDYGPVSLPIADAMIIETEYQMRMEAKARYRASRVKTLANLAEND